MRSYLNYRVLRITCSTSTMIIIYMDLLPRMIAIVDVICFGSVDQWNMFARSGTRTHNLEIRSQSLYRLSLPGWMTTLPVNAYRDFY